MRVVLRALARGNRILVMGLAIVVAVAILDPAGLVPVTSVEPASAAAPSSITLATNRTTIAVGQTAQLTAVTDVGVQSSASTIQIIDLATNAVLKSCATGKTCVVNAAFDTGGARGYVARVGSLSSNVVSVERAAWSVTLTASRTTLNVGQTSVLKATANQNVGLTNGAYSTYIFDLTTETLLASCATGATCRATVSPLFTDGTVAHTYIAAVAATGSPETFASALDVQASSEEQVVSRSDWTVSIESTHEQLPAGKTATITATANQNVGSTGGAYALYLLDVTNGTQLAACTTGTTCRTTISWSSAANGVAVVAVVAAVGDPQTFDEMHDIQTASSSVYVVRQSWQVSLSANQTEIGAGESVKLTATLNQSLTAADGRYSVYIFDAATSKLVRTCSTGKTCSVTRSFYGADDSLYGSLHYYAVVGSPGSPSNPSEVQDSQAWSNWVSISRRPWALTLDRDDSAAPPPGHVQLVVTANQPIDKTHRRNAIYVFNVETGDRAGTCLVGTSCTISVPGDVANPQAYVAVIAERTDPANISDAQSIQSVSGAALTADTYWQVALELDSPTFNTGTAALLTATANHEFGSAFSSYDITIFDSTVGAVVGRCYGARTCAATVSFESGGPHQYQAIIAEYGAESLEAAVDLQATSAPVVLAREAWQITLTANKAELLAGETAEITAVVNQNVGFNEAYEIEIYDLTTAALVKSCRSGTICVWKPDQLYHADGLHQYVALVAARDDNPQLTSAVDVQATSESLTFTMPPWTLELVANRDVFPTGSYGVITASANQDIAGTNGSYAIYYFDLTTGERVGVCTSAVPSSCSTPVVFYEGPPHTYQAVVAKKTTPSTFADLVGTIAVSNTVVVSRLSYEVVLQAYEAGFGHIRVVAATNQNPWISNGNYALYIATQDGVIHCSPYLTCDIYVLPGDGSVVTGVVASADAPYVHDIQATSDEFRSPEPGGPTDEAETAGGGNDAEPGCQCEAGDPVNTATGEFYHSALDDSIAGAGPALAISRTYSATYAAQAGPFGYGWNTNFSARITATRASIDNGTLPQEVVVTQENGATVRFTRGYNGDFHAPLRVQASLSYDSARQTWVFTRKLREILEFNSDGLLTSVKDVHGNAVTIAHSGSGQVTSISASGGRLIEFTWAAGHIIKAVDSAGREVRYTYDAANNLVSVEGIDGSVESYGYDGGHYMTSLTSAGGGTLHNAYDSSHRVVSQTDALGQTTTFSYSGRDRTITGPDGRQVRQTYSASMQLLSQTDGYGTPLAQTSTITYDNASNPATVTNALGETSTSTYDQFGHPVSLTDELGGTSNWTYDALGNPTSFTDQLGRRMTAVYNSVGDRLSVTSQGGRVQQWTYNSAGLPLTYTDQAGNTSTYAYDSAGRMVSSTDPEGRTSSVVYGSDGVVTRTIDPSGSITDIEADAAGRTVSITDPTGAETTFAYDEAGNLTSTTEPSGATTSATYDALGRQTSTTDANGRVTSSAYNSAGLLASVTDALGNETLYTYDILGQLIAVTDGDGHTTRFAYDAAGRQTSATTPSGSVSTLGYDAAGQVINRLDANGDATQYAYDSAGQLSLVIDALGRATAPSYGPDGEVIAVSLPGGASEHYAYDAVGRTTSFTNADGKTTSYTYSTSGNLLNKVEPGGLTSSYTYDSAGRLSTAVRPDGSSTTVSYDVLGRVVRSHSSVAGSVDHTFVYDAAGMLTSVTDSTGTSTYEYDQAHQLIAEVNGAGARITYGYDAVGQLIDLGYPGSRDVQYTYDDAGNMVSVTDWNGATTQFAWTPDSQLASQTDPNGIVESRVYDDAGQLTDINFASAASVLATLDYAYDGAGQLIGETKTAAESVGTRTFGYDPSGQLATETSTGAEGTSSTTLTATPGGLITSLGQGQAFGYNAAQELVSQFAADGTTTTYTYDANGSRTGSAATPAGGVAASTSYAYSPNGALSQVVTPEATVDYTSDARGLRQSRTIAGSTQAFTWSTAGGIPLLLDDGEFSYIYGPSTAPVAQVSDATEATEYLHGDIIGSTRLITDDAGAVVGTTDYSAFGVPVSRSGSAVSAFGFSGNWTDSVTGLVYLRARDYDPATAQFLTVDPAVNATHQPYAYVGNSPLQLVDPLGLFGCEIRNGVAGFLFGVVDGITGGVSSLVLGLVLPGYNEFTSNNGWFIAGQVVGTVGITVATVGVGTVAGLVTRGAIALGRGALSLTLKAGARLTAGVSEIAASSLGRAATGSARRFVAEETGSAAARGGASRVSQGAAGVERTVTDVEAAGGRVLGREVTVEAGGVRTRPDLFVELPNGTQAFIEVKTGPNARLTRNQAIGFPAIRSGGAIPRGSNAAAAGLSPGTPMGPTPVWTVWQPWPLGT